MLHAATAHRIPAAALLIATAACSPSAAQRAVAVAPPPGETGRAVTTVADEYHAGYLETFPLQAFIAGDARASLDRIDDNSLAELARWQAREDAWLRRLEAIAPNALAGTPEAVTHAILREALAAAVAGRVCRSELWRVTQMFGVQQLPTLLATQQPVGTPDRRAAALARYRAFASYIDTEIANLREGVARGYTVPRANVQAVIDQVDQLLAMRPEDSPVMILAKRDGAPELRAALLEVVRAQLHPALDRYRAYLRAEYLPRARQTTAVADLPRGADCYRARVRGFTTLEVDPRTVHQMGLDEGARIQADMRAIAQRAFATSDLRALFDRFRKEDQFRFKNRDEVLAQARSALDRVQAALPRWFGRLPRAPMVLDPCLPFEEKSGCPNSYYPAAQDGSRPAQWRVNTSPERASRVDLEAIAFHEGYPGHHLQIALAQERTGVHPVSRLLFNSGYTEGWGLYSERVASEMGAYSTDMAQLGRLSSAAWRAARLVVDPGLHVLGWSREKAIDYLMANTVISREGATSEVDRYIIMPGQATAYMVGRLEIERLRREAEAHLGAAFDIRAFHDRVLGNGSVPLPFLRADIQAWLKGAAAAPTPGRAT